MLLQSSSQIHFLFFILCFNDGCFYITQFMQEAVQGVINKILMLSSHRTYCLYHHRCKLHLRSMEQFFKNLLLKQQLEYDYSCPQQLYHTANQEIYVRTHYSNGSLVRFLNNVSRCQTCKLMTLFETIPPVERREQKYC